MKNIVIATGNAGKVREFNEMLDYAAEIDLRSHILLSSLADYFNPVPEIVENGSTFYENAKIKADWAFEHTGGIWSLADDSGLEVDALGGAPGVLSARYSGDGATAESNNEKLLYELRGIPEEKRAARFRCALVLKMDTGKYLRYQGCVQGRIIDCPFGEGGFGYDPLFVPNIGGRDKTFAQLEPEEKNKVSHRGGAVSMMYALIALQLGLIPEMPPGIELNIPDGLTLL